jgi:radical SAM protein with 4Fe4S-binding SPASM domain
MLKNNMALIRKAKKLIPTPLKSKIAPFYYFFDNYIKYRTQDFFRQINIETMTACNLRCSYCPNSIYERGLPKNNKKMSWALFAKIINELAELRFNGRIVPNFYNEPLLDKRLPGLLAFARRKLPSSSIHIFTNGQLLDVALYNELAESGVDYITISQHTPLLPDGLNELFSYLKKRKDNPIRIAYRKLAEQSHLCNRGGILKTEKVERMERCIYPSSSMTIDYAGDVVLCCNDYFSSIKFGNLKEEKMKDIWNKHSYRKIRKNTAKGNFELEICQKCSWVSADELTKPLTDRK